MYFDSHAHYNDSKFNDDCDTLLNTMPIVGVINVGTSLKTSRASIALAEKYPFVYATVGTHPHYVDKMTDSDLDAYKDLCEHKKVVAIGEIGLDYHYEHSSKESQRLWFKKQLELAKFVDLPVVVHSREAAAETMALLKESGISKGVLHCYSGHLPMALEYIEMGFYISLSGVVTYKNADKTVEVAAKIPLERLLIETDAPYLSPVPNRGKRNDSSNLAFIAQAIGVARGMTAEEVAKATAKNTGKLFGTTKA